MGSPAAGGPSAADEDRLRQVAARLVAHLTDSYGGTFSDHFEEENPCATQGSAATLGMGGPELADVAYTLQVGREPLRERLALVVSDLTDLCERLHRFASGQDADVLRGRAPRGGGHRRTAW